MQSILHILNGDAIVDGFTSEFPNQKYLVWREALCQGPISYQINSENLKLKRIQFLETHFNHKVKTHLIDDLQTLNLSHYKEMVLWFEYDLFCQVNMMACISWLTQELKELKISILDIERFQKGKYIGLGQISEAQYLSIFSSRIELNEMEISYMDHMWQRISQNDLHLLPHIKPIEKLNRFNHALKTVAIFSNENGLGAAWIEARIIELLKDRSLAIKNLIGQILKKTDELGYGDVQIQFIIDQKIKKGELIIQNEMISLP